MPDHEHLQLRRVQRPPRPRQKVRQGFRRPPVHREHEAHAITLDSAVDQALLVLHQRQEKTPELNPKLMLTFELNRKVPEDKFRVSGLTVLDSSDQHAAVVFASDGEMAAFKRRLGEYRQGPVERERAGDAGDDAPAADTDVAADTAADDDGVTTGEEPAEPAARFEDFFDAIDGFRPLEARDRISARLAEQLDEEPGRNRPVNVDLWFAEDDAARADWLQEVRARVAELGGRWVDTFEDDSARVLVGRIIAPARAVHGLAELDQIALLDAVAPPYLPQDELAHLQDVARIQTPPSPHESAPVIGLVDSGLRSGHPLLAPAVFDEIALHRAFNGQTEDDYGHGTAVAGLALYGDVLSAARAGAFMPAFWLASVRVLDSEGYEPENVNTVRLITDAIRYLAEECECRVINLSFGDPTSPYQGGRASALAAALDTLIRRYDLLLVVSAGNLYPSQLAPQAQLFDRWPQYLRDDGFEIIDPAQSALAITVGAVAHHDSPSSGARHLSVVANAGGPSPFTRHGPGVGKAIKPELAADGGNWVFDQQLDACTPDQAVEVLSTSSRYPDELFGANIGTSFAAAGVTHIAGLLATAYPDLDPLIWRALLLQGARQPTALRDAYSDLDGAELEQVLRDIAGFGELSWERCGLSQDNRVVLYAADSLPADAFHVYRLPITNSFRDVSGPRAMSVSLCFNPPVRYRRLDYIGHQMEFLVVRALDEEQVFAMADADVGDLHARELTAHEVKMHPAVTIRRRGTNQYAHHDWSQRLSTGVDGDWFMVVRSLNKWLRPTHGLQRYALTVTIEVDRADELHAELDIALRAQARARGRAEATLSG